jgi:NAD-dependent dihydropyrimidine dehydrogenase PreA subunit
MIVTGLVFLALGTVIARPYCRFFCPYGVLLGWFSRLSKRHLTITPDECIQCRLCESVCPFDAIRGPEPAPVDRAATRRALAVSLALIPVFMLAGLGLGRLAGRPLSRVHPDVALARAVRAEVATGVRDTVWETRAFWATGAAPASLRAAEADAARRVTTAAGLGGAFLGLMAALRLVALSRRSNRTDFVPDRGECLSCGRCFSSCPREYVRLQRLDGPMMNP